jgi:hypothetical protein
MANYKEKIASIEDEIKQLENRKKEYLQKEKAAERTARNHRICKRGGYIESILPTLISFSDEQFQTFIKRTLLTDYATRELAKIVPQTIEPEATETVETAEQNGIKTASPPPSTTSKTSSAVVEKPTETAKTSGATPNTNIKESRNGAV